MRAASASMILHCLKPMTFPIFNSNMGFDNIYVYFNIGIKRKTELCTYIENVRIVKAFRDKYFTVKIIGYLILRRGRLEKQDNTLILTI